jgi:hypothetical protein
MDASEATPDDQRASVTVDREGIIHQWGDAVTEVVGYSADDAVGQNLNVVIPPVLRPLHWWGLIGPRIWWPAKLDDARSSTPKLTPA